MFVSLNDNDKNDRAVSVVKSYVRLGFNIIATEGTTKFLKTRGIPSRTVLKANQGTLNIIDVIRNGWVQLIINTPLGQVSRKDEHAIGKAAYEYKIPFITTLSAAASAAKSIERMKNQPFTVRSLQEYHALAREKGPTKQPETIEDCEQVVQYIKVFQE